jgi:putative membrane protein
MNKSGWYKILLTITFTAVWAWSATNPTYPRLWLIENLLVFSSIPLIILIGRRLKLSNTSYTLIALFISLHLIGSHYAHAEVPLGYWLQEILGADRKSTL